MGGCERPGVSWAADFPRAKTLMVYREQLIEVNMSVALFMRFNVCKCVNIISGSKIRCRQVQAARRNWFNFAP